MALPASNIPLDMRFHRYIVESLDVLLPGRPEPIKVEPNLINSIMIEKDFDADYFPVLRLSVMMSSDLYYTIVANKTEVRFRMRMQKYAYDSKSSLKFKKDVFNTVFCIFLDENTPFLEHKTLEATQKVTGNEKFPQNVGGNECIFYLFKENDILNSRKIINKVFSSATMTNAVTYCLSVAGFNNVLMTPFENTKSFKEVIVPPLPLLGNLEYLENQYGFYTRGALIFFDIDRLYILDKNPKCTAWAAGEYQKTVFHIKHSTNPDQFSPGSYDDATNKQHFINLPPTSIVMDTPSVVVDPIDGNNLYIINTIAGYTHDLKAYISHRGGGTYKVKVNKYNNEYINWAEKWRREENGRLVQITIGDFDIEALSPNKEFMFLFEDSGFNASHGGNYRISKTIFTFTKQGEEFSISAMATFRKV